MTHESRSECTSLRITRRAISIVEFFLACLFIWLLSQVLSPSTASAEPWKFEIKNDFVIPGGQDRFLSNAFYFSRGDWRIGNEMYTPTDKRSETIDTGDRPWDGYTFLERTFTDRIAHGEYLVLRSRIGMVGRLSGSEALQKFIHNDLGLGQHPSWSGQNPSEYVTDSILSKRSVRYLHSVIGDTSIREEYGARFGTVNVSAFLDQEITKHLGRYLYLYAGLRGDVVAYNTHLDGREFRDNLYSVDREWFVATARAGLEIYLPRSHHAFLRYGYSYVTEEFQGQRGRHSYGELSFGTKF